MATRIRLARAGAKKRPYYRVVVADSRASRDGKFIEKIGAYNPMLPKDSAERVKLDKERVEYWLGKGAVPSERVVLFLNQAKIGQDNSSVKLINKKRDNVIKLKAKEIEERKKRQAEEEAAKKKAAEEEAKAAKEAEEAAAKEAEAAAAAAEAPAEEATPAAEEKAEAPAEEKPAEEAKSE